MGTEGGRSLRDKKCPRRGIKGTMANKTRKGGAGGFLWLRILFVCVVVFLLCPLGETAEDPGRAKVVKVIDGDSLLVRYQGRSLRVRLWGVDTPEYDQDSARSAKQYTANLVLKGWVELEVKDWDKYGRMVALVTTEQQKCVNEELVKAGLAWVYPYFCNEPVCERWRVYQDVSRGQRAGLWAKERPIPPWQWRSKKRH